jgi:hypothetical protein
MGERIAKASKVPREGGVLGRILELKVQYENITASCSLRRWRENKPGLAIYKHS